MCRFRCENAQVQKDAKCAGPKSRIWWRKRLTPRYSFILLGWPWLFQPLCSPYPLILLTPASLKLPAASDPLPLPKLHRMRICCLAAISSSDTSPLSFRIAKKKEQSRSISFENRVFIMSTPYWRRGARKRPGGSQGGRVQVERGAQVMIFLEEQSRAIQARVRDKLAEFVVYFLGSVQNSGRECS